MDLFVEFLQKLWVRIMGRDTNQTRSLAKERLRLVLVHDRVDISPQCMDAIREEMLKVASKYMEINEQETEISLLADNSSISLVANMPVIRIKRAAKSEIANKYSLAE